MLEATTKLVKGAVVSNTVTPAVTRCHVHLLMINLIKGLCNHSHMFALRLISS